MTLVRYQPIDDRFAELANRMLKGKLVDASAVKGIAMLLSAHRRVFNSIVTIRNRRGEMVAPTYQVMALQILMRLMSEVTADASMDAVCQS